MPSRVTFTPGGDGSGQGRGAALASDAKRKMITPECLA